MEPPCGVRPIAEWCILGIEVYSGTGQLSFLSPRGGKYIEIPRGARYHHGVLSFGGTYMEVSFDVIAEREYDGLDPDYRNWYTLTETGNAVA